MRYASSFVTSLCVLALTASLAPAQPRVADKRVLTLEGAKRIIAAAVAEAQRKHAPGGAIAVVDDGGNLLALERLDNTFAASANIAIGKARTAALFRKPTKLFEETVNMGRTADGKSSGLHPAPGRRADLRQGMVVGAVGVSGAASAPQDEEIALADGQVFADLTSEPGESAIDGIKVDQAGTVYVCGLGGLWIFSSTGTRPGLIRGPEETHNLAWGDDDGRTLYITAQTSIYRIRSRIPGARS